MAQRFTVTINPDHSWIEDAPTYDQIVESFGNVFAQADQDDYQGDSLYALRAGDRYGVVTVGWGSCSGCDALDAARSQSDIDELQDDIERGIMWFDSVDELKLYVAGPGLEDSYLEPKLLREFREALGVPTRSDASS